MKFVFLCLFIICAGVVESGLEDRIKKFDVFNLKNVKHSIKKRHAIEKDTKILEFKTLGRDFKLHLVRDTSLFTKDFKVVAVDNKGERVVNIRPELYHGQLQDNSESQAHVYMEEDGSFIASVSDHEKKFHFEPSWKFTGQNDSMLAYQEGDVNMKEDLGAKFCGSDWFPSKKEKDEEEEEEEDGGRVKRSSCSRNGRMVCTLKLVADYRYYVAMGKQNLQATTGNLISVIDQVNDIYKKQEFGVCGEGFMFEIREIRIHTEFSGVNDAIYAYNIDKQMTTSELLETFSRNSDNTNYCLAHLFTHISFPGGVLGLAYIGSRRRGSLGGLGSASYYKDGYLQYLNTGWSSSVNKYNRILLAAEAYIVTAHELGHNWGSEHDADTEECSPRHGKFIMYMYSVNGREANNRKFSPCSRRSIAATLQSKADLYFSKKSDSFCGNYKVEDDEECDEGPEEGDDVSLSSLKKKCCTKCKLTPGSVCSDLNEQCCEGCSYASIETTCLSSRESQCKKSSHCSGVDTRCLEASNFADGTPCLEERGKCRNGRCMNLCEYQGLEPCICTGENACRWCCMASNDTCAPLTNKPLPPGTPCYQGLCDQDGKCEKQTGQDTIQRLWKIIENIDANKLVLFMRANIVGTVIVLSLLLWLPASCLVSFIDRKRAKKEMDEYQWRDPNNDKLLLPWQPEGRPRIINRDY